MGKFSFYQDKKVTCWTRTHFSVTANNQEEAIAIVRSWKGEDVTEMLDEEVAFFSEYETLYETEEALSVRENAGMPTIEVFTEQGKEIMNNQVEQ